jgi:hypothetical protein
MSYSKERRIVRDKSTLLKLDNIIVFTLLISYSKERRIVDAP